ncbi:MAG: lytic murein transglycosylase [Arcobacter sp.]|nr:lytic murein transglycosylase [Arcobacter sp.]|tara:strand:- start:3158 stop:4810 length:1653 start_codon:yes stop_codon:yes gene_type:complete
MKKIIASLVCVIALNLNVNAEAVNITDKGFKVTLDWLDEKPQSYAKDFFIIQYLNQKNISEEDAQKAYDMSKAKTGRVKKVFTKRFSKIPNKDLRCYRAKPKELLNEDSRCIALGLSIFDATTMSKENLKIAIDKIKDYPTLANDLKVFASDNPFNALINTNTSRFYRLFFNVGNSFRKDIINNILPESFIDKLSNEDIFNRFIAYVVHRDGFEKLQKSLFNIKNNNKITNQTFFSLALNAINHKEEAVALNYLNKAYSKSYFQSDKDRALFWIYLLTQNKTFLDQTGQSWDNNLYSLYAKELLDIEVENIYYDIDIPNTLSSYNTLDQFEWIEVEKDTKKNLDDEKLAKYTKLFTDASTLPHYAYVLERHSKYRKSYYIKPFRNVMKNYDINRQVLMYAIGRQESRFIPSAVSFATAQGVMQIMPFLSEQLAKDLKEPYNIYEQFLPEINLRFANKHLNTLEKQFDKNPLFIAYAYNGGPGYTRKQFKRGLFKNKNRFEPFMSMEQISYEETRKYGKKVLSNYYIYNNHLNKENKVTLSSIFQTLIWPN